MSINDSDYFDFIANSLDEYRNHLPSEEYFEIPEEVWERILETIRECGCSLNASSLGCLYNDLTTYTSFIEKDEFLKDKVYDNVFDEGFDFDRVLDYLKEDISEEEYNSLKEKFDSYYSEDDDSISFNDLLNEVFKYVSPTEAIDENFIELISDSVYDDAFGVTENYVITDI